MIISKDERDAIGRIISLELRRNEITDGKFVPFKEFEKEEDEIMCSLDYIWTKLSSNGKRIVSIFSLALSEIKDMK